MPNNTPEVVDRATFQAELDRLRGPEKAHTHAGDAIAAARRRLPMVEMDSSITLIGPHGPVTLLETFEGRRRAEFPDERPADRTMAAHRNRAVRRPRQRAAPVRRARAIVPR